MGENLFDARYADARPTPQVQPLPQPVAASNGTVNGEEEPYTIKCICGFLDDDGHTVLCEQCNTWQHIECYYWPELVVPEVHQCTDCSPRVLASSEAAQRQRRHREPLSLTDDRRLKRPNTKTHKKARTKEHNSLTGLQNGWPPQEQSIADFRNGATRDQPPPAKRPKTNHRTSTSLSLQTLPRPFGHRDLNGLYDPVSLRPARVALTDCPPDYLSPEFIRMNREDDDFTIAQANTHLNIGVANLLAKWLDDVDAFAEATQGRTQGQVFKFFPQPIEDLETPIQQHTREDTSVTFHGYHPVWKYLTADRDIGFGNMIGEVRGTIGRLEDYKEDPANEWDRLRHPDHFVFFHPALPIFIDCRREGTLLRYARRSCRPNMSMETIITGEREYRFCFTALTDIPRDAEITIGWDLTSHPRLRECLESQHAGHKKTSTDEKAYIQKSVETILAHFGDCACEERPESCLMGHFDHRLAHLVPDFASHNTKLNRKRKSVKKTTPENLLDDHSRAGSEHMLQEDDVDDNRSTSRSTRSKPSREHTPTSASFRDAALKPPEISERDKKKLLQEEMLFNKLEQEKQQVPRKKKRNSGSNVNTPSVATSKQLGRRNSLTSTVNTPAPSGRNRGNYQQTSYFNQGRTPSDLSPQPRSPHPVPNLVGGASNGVLHVVKPTYVTGGTQTGSTQTPSGNAKSIAFRKPAMSLSRHFLRLSRAANISVTQEMNYEEPYHKLNAESGVLTQQSTQPPAVLSLHSFNSIVEEAPDDVEMKDIPSPDRPSADTRESFTAPSEPHLPQPQITQQPLQSPHPPIIPSAPPWQAPLAPMHLPLPPSRTNIRSANLHVELPPPPLQSSDILLDSVPGLSSSHLVQTPMNSTLPLVSAIANSAYMNPSPMKKKMSLSDYTAKLKAKTPALEKSQSMAEPGSSSPLLARQQPVSDLASTPEAATDPSLAIEPHSARNDSPQSDLHGA